ncbi:MAG TPA: hypothetical protein VHC47_06135 [Mucilaginibacter sp.]|nr:hypothetical protein [Mucilaginibacter sp.]
MKCLNFRLTVFSCLTASSLLAQTPQQIEADLLRSFKKIDYWYQRANDTTANADLAANDSLENANDFFARKLKNYAEKYPSTITYPFDSIRKRYLSISTSADGLFRIYSWDKETGGTMHFFENVMQYKTGVRTMAVIDTPQSEGDFGPSYNKINTFEAKGGTYYLTNYLFVESSRYSAFGITVFTIEGSKLVAAKIIRTSSGLHSGISYEVDFSKICEKTYSKLPQIHFSNATNTIYLPVVNWNYQMTNKFILYKFTGRYFERVKN